MAVSAFIVFSIAVWGGMTTWPTIPMKAENLIAFAFFEFRYASAGFMIVYVEIWSCWNRFRRNEVNTAAQNF